MSVLLLPDLILKGKAESLSLLLTKAYNYMTSNSVTYNLNSHDTIQYILDNSL